MLLLLIIQNKYVKSYTLSVDIKLKAHFMHCRPCLIYIFYVVVGTIHIVPEPYTLSVYTYMCWNRFIIITCQILCLKLYQKWWFTWMKIHRYAQTSSRTMHVRTRLQTHECMYAYNRINTKKNILVLPTVIIYSEIFSLNAHESSTPHCFVESIFTIYNLKTVLK